MRTPIGIIFGCVAAWSQTHTATVRGFVKDSSAAPVQGASVSFTNVDQQLSWDVRTDEAGEYALVQIPPGRYTLTIKAKGFKKYDHDGLALQVAQTFAFDVSLEVGAVSETLQVTSEVSLLEPASSFLGEVVSGKSADALPLTTRNITQLVALAPGVSDTRNFRGPAFSSGNPSRVQFSANGGRGITNEILLDGSPQTVMDLNEPAYIPMPEAVQEFNVQSNSLPAEYGRSGGAVINIVHRSGTKDFHGSLYEFLRNDELNANYFFANKSGQPKPSQRGNEFGFSLGGPATISRKSTFFFINYQRILVRGSGATTLTVPTAGMKNGDFSEVAATIYDPNTIDAAGRRSPFPGNQVPANRWNPIGVNLLKFYPNPTSAGVSNNFFSNAGQHVSATDLSLKIDRRISSRQNLFGRFSLENYDAELPNHFGNLASPDAANNFGRNHSASLDDSYTLGGWILHGNYGYAYSAAGSDPITQDFNLTSLGFPAYLNNAAQIGAVPSISVTGYAGLGASVNLPGSAKYETHALTADAARSVGRHTVKFGGAYRISRTSVLQTSAPSGLFQFNEGFTRQMSSGNTGGHPIASLLLGLPFGAPNAGSIGYEPALALQMRYGAVYAQDDWRVNERLTVNLGLRWDTDRPLTERFDRTAWFDFNAILPLAVPGLGPLRGGLRFAGRDGAPRAARDPDNNDFAPRAGLAYKLSEKIVLRSGFGIMFAPMSGIGPTTATTGAISFNASTPYVSTIDGGRTPFTTISDPFPRGFNAPANGRDGLLTFVGQDIRAQVRGDRNPYVAQWHFNAQHEVRNEMLFDLGYVGSAGVKLLTQTQLDQLPDQYLALGDGLNRVVPNPFFGILGSTTALGQPTTTAGQLLRPYPQLNSLTYNWGSFAHSSYHSLQAKFRKRYRAGLQLMAAYTWSKMLDDASGPFTGGIQNPGSVDNNRRDWDKAYSSYDIPHRFVLNFEYELPVGVGRPLLNRKGIVNAIAGGWRVTGIGTLQSGPPISVNTTNATSSFNGGNAAQRPNRTGITSRTTGSVRERLDNYLDRAAFVNPPRFTFGDAGRFLPENRAPGLETWDVSLAKSFAIRESLRLSVRAETFNLLNRANFLSPAIGFNTAQFGTITGTENPRWIQLALKLYF